MKLGDYVKSNYMNADDFDAKGEILTITSVIEESVGNKDGDGDDKPVLYFEGQERGISLGKETAGQLIKIFGSEETNDWIGRQVVAFRDDSVKFGARKVGGIRFRPAR